MSPNSNCSLIVKDLIIRNIIHVKINIKWIPLRKNWSPYLDFHNIVAKRSGNYGFKSWKQPIL